MGEKIPSSANQDHSSTLRQALCGPTDNASDCAVILHELGEP